MTKTVDEYWQLIEDILRRKDRTRSHGEQLRESVADLLATPQGRDSIRDRLNGEGGKFEGRQRFVDEIVRVLESPKAADADMSPGDRLAIQETVVTRTRPKVDSAHWNMLWLLRHEGNINAGKIVLESLTKVAKKGDDLLRSLPNLPAWKQIAPDRIVTLLEAAQQASRDVELTNRIERVLSWARNLGSTKGNRDVDHANDTSLAERAASGSSSGTSAVEQPERAAGQAPQPRSLRVPRNLAQTLPSLLKAIENLFKEQEARHTELQQARNNSTEELERLHADLQAQEGLTRKYMTRVDQLELDLKEHARELAEVCNKMRQVEHQLAEAQQEAESARHRADDYIHEATLARDNAVRSFQASLWDRLRSCLVEVLDESAQNDGLSAEQQFFRHRLQEIRDALSDLGVPPY